MTSADTSLDELNHWMQAHHMHGYWMPPGTASSQRQPQLWKWADVDAGLAKASELVPSGPSRTTGVRTIRLHHPEEHGVPRTFSLGARTLLPGERNRAYITPYNEACFVIQSAPGVTFVSDGEASPMTEGDLIVSPIWTGQEYLNDGSMTAIWLAARDTELCAFMGMARDECSLLDQTEEVPMDPGFFSATQVRMKNLSVLWGGQRLAMRYPGADVLASLAGLKEGTAGADRYDGIHLRYTSLVDGGATLPTLSCEIQLLPPKLQTDAHRHNSMATYYVFRGEGRTEVGGEWLEWTQGDMFSIPPWTWHHHENPSSDDAILYSIDDWPAMAKMGFYRVEGEEETLR